jgi:hypothetical protein
VPPTQSRARICATVSQIPPTLKSRRITVPLSPGMLWSAYLQSAATRRIARNWNGLTEKGSGSCGINTIVEKDGFKNDSKPSPSTLGRFQTRKPNRCTSSNPRWESVSAHPLFQVRSRGKLATAKREGCDYPGKTLHTFKTKPP